MDIENYDENDSFLEDSQSFIDKSYSFDNGVEDLNKPKIKGISYELKEANRRDKDINVISNVSNPSTAQKLDYEDKLTNQNREFLLKESKKL